MQQQQQQPQQPQQTQQLQQDENLTLFLIDEHFFRVRNARAKLRDLYQFLEIENLMDQTAILCVKTYSAKTVGADDPEELLRKLYVDTSKPTSVSLQIKEQTFYPSVLFLVTLPGLPYLKDMNVDALVTVSNERMRTALNGSRYSLATLISDLIAAFRLQFFNIERTSPNAIYESTLLRSTTATSNNNSNNSNNVVFDNANCTLMIEETRDERPRAFTATNETDN